jgi:hypothetical protein
MSFVGKRFYEEVDDILVGGVSAEEHLWTSGGEAVFDVTGCMTTSCWRLQYMPDWNEICYNLVGSCEDFMDFESFK